MYISTLFYAAFFNFNHFKNLKVINNLKTFFSKWPWPTFFFASLDLLFVFLHDFLTWLILGFHYHPGHIKQLLESATIWFILRVKLNQKKKKWPLSLCFSSVCIGNVLPWNNITLTMWEIKHVLYIRFLLRIQIIFYFKFHSSNSSSLKADTDTFLCEDWKLN